MLEWKQTVQYLYPCPNQTSTLECIEAQVRLISWQRKQFLIMQKRDGNVQYAANPNDPRGQFATISVPELNRIFGNMENQMSIDEIFRKALLDDIIYDILLQKVQLNANLECQAFGMTPQHMEKHDVSSQQLMPHHFSVLIAHLMAIIGHDEGDPELRWSAIILMAHILKHSPKIQLFAIWCCSNQIINHNGISDIGLYRIRCLMMSPNLAIRRAAEDFAYRMLRMHINN